MKKILLWMVGGVLLLGVAAMIVVTFFLGHIVKSGVNTFGPQLTQTKVELAGATISPFSGGGTLTGLTVDNPAGWSAERAFSLGRIHLKLKPFSLLGDHIVIDELVIEGPEFTYETKLLESNIGQLLANIEKFSGSTPSKSGKPVKFEVKKFRLTQGKVTAGVHELAPISVPMPDLAFDNLGTKEGGITADQLAGAVMRNISNTVIQAGKEAALKAASTLGQAALMGTNGITQGAKKTLDSLKGILSK